MNKITVSDFKDEIVGKLRRKLDEICAELNSKYEDYIFYIKDDGIWLDCSDYSPRDVKIFTL